MGISAFSMNDLGRLIDVEPPQQPDPEIAEILAMHRREARSEIQEVTEEPHSPIRRRENGTKFHRRKWSFSAYGNHG